MQLPRLSNSQYEEFEEKARMSGGRLDECPTCGSRPEKVTDEELGEAEGRQNGTYRLFGEEHACDCETQMQLRKHYLLANIGDQYIRLNWDWYDGSEVVRTMVAKYLDNWPSMKRNGMGLELGGPDMGTGKTFTATYVARELVKRGERVYFIPFLEVASLYQKPEEERERLHKRLRETTILVLDEVRPPSSHAQQGFFSEKLEEVIRHRTNFNLPTIIGTNLTQTELEEYYPRVYSLLCAKQMRIDFSGADQRMARIANENLELALNGEVRPIT